MKHIVPAFIVTNMISLTYILNTLRSLRLAHPTGVAGTRLVGCECPLRCMILVTAKSAKSAKICLNCLVFDYNKFRVSDRAISSVVSAILVLGLIVAFTTMIHISYIPAWKNDAERCHMDDTWSDMADLKSKIDILSAGLVINPASNILMSVPVKMGGGDIPIVSTGKSSGTLSVNIKDTGMKILAENALGTTIYDSNTSLLNLGAISYQSSNNYYLNQLFEYENGALMIVQDKRSLIKFSPAIILRRVNETNLSVSVSAVELIGHSRSISSNTIEEIRLSSNASVELFISQDLVSDVDIIVYTDYPAAWKQYFNTSAGNGNLKYSDDYTMTSDDTSVTLSVTGGPGEDIQLNVNKNVIDVSVRNI